MSFRSLRFLVGFALIGICVSTAFCALPPLDKQTADEMSSHLVTGKVVAIYKYRDQVEPGLVYDRYVAELLVKDVHKGKKVKPDRIIYIRYYSLVENTAGLIGPAGHDPRPGKGQTVKVYLSKAEDGGLDVLQPNGFYDK